MKQMKFLQTLLLLTPVVCLLAQTQQPQTTPLPPPPGQAAADKPPTVSLSTEPAPGASAAVPPDKVVLTIGDEKITAAEFDKMLERIPPQYRAQMRTPQGRRNFAENIIRLKVMAEEGRKRKLEDDPVFKEQLEQQKEQLLAQSMYKDLVSTVKVDPETARKYYDEHRSEYEQLKAVHILIRVKGSPVPLKAGHKELTEEEALAKAKEIRSKLVGGADFATVAKAESDDAASAAKGGDLGTFGHGRMVPEFEKAAFSMKVGEISEPVKSQFGYHIIKVEERQDKTFEEARPDIDRKLNGEAVNKAMSDMTASAKVVMDEDFFGKPMPPKPSLLPPQAKPATK
jgi:peptidyl-prolyl cis-trans isomerase C